MTEQDSHEIVRYAIVKLTIRVAKPASEINDDELEEVTLAVEAEADYSVKFDNEVDIGTNEERLVLAKIIDTELVEVSDHRPT